MSFQPREHKYLKMLSEVADTQVHVNIFVFIYGIVVNFNTKPCLHILNLSIRCPSPSKIIIVESTGAEFKISFIDWIRLQAFLVRWTVYNEAFRNFG